MNTFLVQKIRERGRGAQSQLAGLLGLQPQSVNKWVSGGKPIPEQRWVDVAIALELDPMDIIRASGVLDFFPEMADRFEGSGIEELRRLWYAYVGAPARPVEKVDALAVLGNPEETDSRKLWAAIHELAEHVQALERAVFGEDGVEVTPQQFGVAADVGQPPARVVGEPSRTRPKVGPAEGE